ncbi:DUF4272 domain-containing protein [Paenibacillus profundus]|uniref:DUF4272 domain-containing protein n=1 Tax=Paenibacillus profundus TaxID=1173085 RepID=A0ABS8YCZ3_9BACL|nr:DUF4272 domain-containing protein [Paenibacillus profundus]MCE5168867.1 DUF4272 domain-containing protein [Paenibacillus profundus]
MQHCTLYVSMKDDSKIIEAILDTFGDKQVQTSEDGHQVMVIDKKLFSKRTTTFSIMTKETGGESFANMIRGMYGYYDQIDTPHQTVKEKLLLQISALTAAIGIVADKEIDNKSFAKILEVAAKIHAVIFLPTGDMLDNQGRLVLNVEGESELDDFRPTVTVDLIDAHIKATPEGEARKRRTMELLTEQGIPVIDHLPVIVGDDDALIRPKEEIVQRAIALCMIAMYAGGLAEESDLAREREFIHMIMEQYGAESFFTENERDFLTDDNPDRTDMIQFAWMYECCWVLLWALGYVEQLDFPGDICDVQSAIDVLRNAGDYDTFYNNAVVRTKAEILEQTDRIYRYDWACVNERINNRPIPGGLNDEVVVERHRAFNWLICYMDADWDHVRTDT